MTTIGFVGLGAIEGRVVKRLLDAEYPTTGYNRTKPKVQWLAFIRNGRLEAQLSS